MDILMRRDEVVLLRAFMHAADSYLEFGCGGSTWIAAQSVRRSVITIDSHAKWIAETQARCQLLPVGPQLTFFHVDIGETVDLGYPRGYPSVVPSSQSWISYHTSIWKDPSAAECDLFLVDGRFRVACALQIFMRGKWNAFLAVHDYPERSFYHSIELF